MWLGATLLQARLRVIAATGAFVLEIRTWSRECLLSAVVGWLNRGSLWKREMAKITALQIRWLLLGAFLVLGVIGMFSSRVPYRVETLQICRISGAVHRETTWMGFRRQAGIEHTAWEEWIREREPAFEFEFVPWCSYQSFLMSIRRSCVRSPAVAQLQEVSADTLATVPVDRLQSILNLVRKDDDKAQRDAVANLVKELR